MPISSAILILSVVNGSIALLERVIKIYNKSQEAALAECEEILETEEVSVCGDDAVTNEESSNGS